MEKEIEKCYEYLNLPITASIEDVELRQKALVKIYCNKSQEKGVSYGKQIGLVETSAKTIIENIKNNGIPKEESHRFDSSWKSIGILAIVLAFVGILCFFSFYVLL